MEKKEKNTIEAQIGLPKEIKGFTKTWPENLTELDLSHQNFDFFDETTVLPPHLTTLNLANNNLEIVPEVVLRQGTLKHLNLSLNKIAFFDDFPSFCHTIEHLNLARNKLQSPPYWIWTETPKNLCYLDLSYNLNIAQSLDESCLEAMLEYHTPVAHLVIHNCRLGKFEKLFGTFPQVRDIEIGAEEFHCFTANLLDTAPGEGLSKCCNIERLGLRNVKLFSLKSNIAIYKYLVEINLADNRLRGLPNEFCSLDKLQTCNLSNNYVMSLPEGFSMLRELQCLYIDNNALCLLPDDLTSLPKLKTLDLYNNELHEVPDSVWILPEVDAAQNYLEEPDKTDYIERKTRLRMRIKETDRMNGNKVEVEPESEHSTDTTDDETFMKQTNSDLDKNQQNLVQSSSEDWDSDRYWVPHSLRPTKIPSNVSWLHFIQKRLKEGRFCPIDLHTVPVYDKVIYERQCNPRLNYVSDGQFDSLTDDDS